MMLCLAAQMKKSKSCDLDFLAGVAGFGPTDARVKVWCLTAWLHPKKINVCYYSIFLRGCQVLFPFFSKMLDNPM